MTQRKIVLGGGGDAVASKKIDDLYGELLPTNAKVLYIPIAWKSKEFDSCLEWFTETYERFGFTIEMLTDLKNCDVERIHTFDSIYIGGGNTFSLLHKFRETNFIEILKTFIESGKVVYGGSAGAIILGKDIQTSSFGTDSDVNEVGLEDFSGLNLVNGYAIQCHYEANQYAELKDFALKECLNIFALPEDSGLFINGDTIERIGTVTEIKVT
jgi:dipeptidase E